MKQFNVVPINDDEFSLTPSSLNVGCMYFVTYIPTDVTGQREQGSADLKKVMKLENNAMLRGGIEGYLIPQCRKKIGKYRNTVSKIDEIPIPRLFSVTLTCKLHPSRVFVYLKHLCTSNQSQPLRGNVRRPRIQSVQRSKRMPYQFHHRLSVRNCVIIYH